jgi:hypothetical protein
MRNHILRKILIVIIFIAPIFPWSGCKKQAKCGCGGDVLYSLTKIQSKVYFNESGATITCQTLDNPYATYYFCNPGAMFPKLKGYKSGDILMVTGQVFWECNYLSQSSNYAYQSYYKVYMIMVSDVEEDLYGKK